MSAANSTPHGLRAGDIMVGPIGGFVPGLLPVGAGQLALFLTRRWWRHARSIRSWWHFRHVAIVGEAALSRGFDQLTLIQAMPKGCEEIPLSVAKYLTSDYLFIRPDYRTDYPNVIDYLVADAARRYVGTPYNVLTYAKLAAGAFRMRLTERWLLKHMSTRRDMMCSQHVDQSLADAGYHVFDDGRLPQDVVPAELAIALLSKPGWSMIPTHPVHGQWRENLTSTHM